MSDSDDVIYGYLRDILDVDEVFPVSVLAEYETWDSLSILAIISMADEKFAVTITRNDIKRIVTAKDLAEFIKKSISK